MFEKTVFWFFPKVLVHSPHNRLQEGRGNDNDISLLSINQHVTAVCAGKLNPSLPNDVLAVGTQTNLMVYDIEKNRDLFYKEVCVSFNEFEMLMFFKKHFFKGFDH